MKNSIKFLVLSVSLVLANAIQASENNAAVEEVKNDIEFKQRLKEFKKNLSELTYKDEFIYKPELIYGVMNVTSRNKLVAIFYETCFSMKDVNKMLLKLHSKHNVSKVVIEYFTLIKYMMNKSEKLAWAYQLAIGDFLHKKFMKAIGKSDEESKKFFGIQSKL